MSILGRRHLDAPIDYRALWVMLRNRIEELTTDQAIKAMEDSEDQDIYKKQGAYRFGYTILSEMERILEETRKSYGPLRQSEDNDTA